MWLLQAAGVQLVDSPDPSLAESASLQQTSTRNDLLRVSPQDDAIGVESSELAERRAERSAADMAPCVSASRAQSARSMRGRVADCSGGSREGPHLTGSSTSRPHSVQRSKAGSSAPCQLPTQALAVASAPAKRSTALARLPSGLAVYMHNAQEMDAASKAFGRSASNKSNVATTDWPSKSASCPVTKCSSGKIWTADTASQGVGFGAGLPSIKQRPPSAGKRQW
jgi:hypothetical protein